MARAGVKFIRDGGQRVLGRRDLDVRRPGRELRAAHRVQAASRRLARTTPAARVADASRRPAVPDHPAPAPSQRGHRRVAGGRAGGFGAHDLSRHPRPLAVRRAHRGRGRRRVHPARAASTCRRSCSTRPRSRRWCSARASSRATATRPWRRQRATPSHASRRCSPTASASGSTRTPLFAPGFHVPTEVLGKLAGPAGRARVAAEGAARVHQRAGR